MKINNVTKMTGQTVVLGMPSCTSASGLGLGTTGLSFAGPCLVSGPRNAEGTRVETGLSRDWATFVDGLELRDERPTQAPKAEVAAAKHGHYAAAVGAGSKQQDQQIHQAMAAFSGAKAIRMRAFRGPEPWSERT
ncbi:hypothetical protein ACGFX4_00625 [Kitasatospora sp. NPDC048365]|uniref:hypothetical protein n=1 Tax=Kitasatospora sp. NPDC048365 TaxID=3364050 RepID=UPI00371F175D